MHDPAPETQIRTTDGTIALFNLNAQIERLDLQVVRGQLTSRCGAELVDRLMLRGQILSLVADYERAATLAEQLVRKNTDDGLAFLVRARTRGCLHRFEEALSDLDLAGRLGLAGSEVEAERAAVFQAVGRHDEALALHQAAARRRVNFETLGALASLYAECGEVDTAERVFGESRLRFRGVSPFALVQLDFQRGRMWQEQGDLARAREWLLAAWHRLPAYAHAEGHLAEVEAEMGEPETAIARLRRLALASDDPDYAAQLARILAQIGRCEEAVQWRLRAEARYDELIARHPAAFADHAAEFWLTPGGDAERALTLAKHNADLRQTPRARALLSRALAMCENQPAA